MNRLFSSAAMPIAAAPPVAPPQPSLTDKMTGFFRGTPYPVLVLIAIITIVAVIVFIIIRVQRGSLKTVKMNDKVILANPLAGNFQVMPAGKLPATTNGSECTYSVWIFVDNVAMTNDHKIVMYRGNSTTYANGVFYVYMDAKTNKLYASVRTNGALSEASGNQEPRLSDINKNKYFLQSTIDYIPLQRWVNVTYTAKDTVLSTFLDGELYSVTSIYEMPAKPDGSRPLPTKHEGDVMMGGTGLKEGFNGYIGTSSYYNFAATVQEVKIIYNSGPYSRSWLSWLGVNNIGVRNPVYRISADTVVSKQA